jgi:hypothetical protein
MTTTDFHVHGTTDTINHIFDHVWIGGYESICTEPGTTTYINCTPLAHMHDAPGEYDEAYNFSFKDDPINGLSGPDWHEATSAFIEAMNARTRGHRVVARCHQGLNRSALIALGVLIAESRQIDHKYSVPHQDLKVLIDNARYFRHSSLLHNKHFEKVLLHGGWLLRAGEIVWYCGSQLEAHGWYEVVSVIDGRPILRSREIITFPNGNKGRIELEVSGAKSIRRGRAAWIESGDAPVNR